MKINRITNSMNFGLKKSEEYMIFENDLINRINNPQKKVEAQRVAAAIGRRCPEGYLDVKNDKTGFLFYKNGTSSDAVEIKRKKLDAPLTILLKINKFLKNL